MSVFTVLCWTSSELRTQHEATLLYIFGGFAKLSEGWTKLSFREKIELGTKLTEFGGWRKFTFRDKIELGRKLAEIMAGANLPFGTKLRSGEN